MQPAFTKYLRAIGAGSDMYVNARGDTEFTLISSHPTHISKVPIPRLSCKHKMRKKERRARCKHVRLGHVGI